MADPLVVPIDKDILQNCKGLKSVSEAPAGEYLMEAKFDGFRLTMRHNEDGTVDVFTRNGKCQNGKLPWQEAEFKHVFPPGTVVDGEICAPLYNEETKTFDQCFEYVQHVMLSKTDTAVKKQEADRKLTFYIFDVLVLGGKDCRQDTLMERREKLTGYMGAYGRGGVGENVKISNAWPAVDETHRALCRKGFEGSVIKSISSKYSSGKRGYGWFKMKKVTDFDAVIIGFKPGSNKNKGKVGGVIFGQHSPPEITNPKKFKGSDYLELEIDGITYISRGSFGAISDQFRDELTADPDSFLGKVVTARHMGAMHDGRKFRHPEFVRLRPDKVPAECGWDDGE